MALLDADIRINDIDSDINQTLLSQLNVNPHLIFSSTSITFPD